MSRDVVFEAAGTLRRSYEGHGLVRDAGGSAVVVEHRAAQRRRLRAAHGASIVFYTDGLVERNRIPLQEGLDWLLGVLDGHQGLSAEGLCDHLIARSDDTVADDVALLVLRRRGRRSAADR